MQDFREERGTWGNSQGGVDFTRETQRKLNIQYRGEVTSLVAKHT